MESQATFSLVQGSFVPTQDTSTRVQTTFVPM